jgi:hypothetical protein
MGVTKCPRCEQGTLVFVVGLAAMPVGPTGLGWPDGKPKVPVVEAVVATCVGFGEGCSFRVAGHLTDGSVLTDGGVVVRGDFVPDPRLVPFRPGWTWTLLRQLEIQIEKEGR